MILPPTTGVAGGTNADAVQTCCYGPTCGGKTIWGWPDAKDVPADLNSDELLQWYARTSPASPCASGVDCPWASGPAPYAEH